MPKIFRLFCFLLKIWKVTLSVFDKVCTQIPMICKILFRGAADSSCHGAKYRRMLWRLRKQLLLTETYMCAHRWNAIDFSKVPSLCMNHHKHAFLNEKIAGGVKHPEDPERIACRERLLEHLVSGAKLNGQQLFPHELAHQVCRADGCRRACEMLISALFQVLDVILYLRVPALSKAASAVIDAQWVCMRNGIIEQVESRKRQLALAAAPIDRAEALEHADVECSGSVALSIVKQVMVDAAVSSRAAKPVGLSRVVSMIDVSASMTGTPLEAAVALGILASELSHEAFRGRVLTFSEEPAFIDIRGETSFVKKVKRLVKSNWGCSTDFYRAMELICAVVRKHELGADDIPDLLVNSTEPRVVVGARPVRTSGECSSPLALSCMDVPWTHRRLYFGTCARTLSDTRRRRTTRV